MTLTYSKDNSDAFNAVEEQLTPALNSIIEGNVSDYLGYAFQIYSTFIANAKELKPHYQLLCESVLDSLTNWGKEMKYLVPALTLLVTTIICKFPDYARSKM